MEMSRSVPEVQVKNGLPADPEQMMMRKDKEKRSVIPIALEKLLKEKREKGDEFAIQRWAWENGRGKYFGSFEDTTVVPPMSHTFGSIPILARPDHTLQIFSIKVVELKGKNDLKWPLQVYGSVAIRDSIDPRRNLLFHRDRSNCQTITEKEPFLLLTGPSRAVVLIDSVSFEVQLTAKGTTKPSEDKVLAVDAFSSYHAIAYMSHPVMS